jgi:hypothetical protein
VVALDCETRVSGIDQRLLFGSVRVYAASGRLVEEDLIVADDLTTDERVMLEEYLQTHRDERGRQLRLLSRKEFADRILWRTVYKGRATLIGFNLFFDLSRLALGWRPARGSTFAGGFSLIFWPEWTGPKGPRPHQYRPEIRIRSLDSRRSLIQFSAPARIDPENLGVDGKPFPGHFVDCRALAYAFSDRGHTLESACEAFGVERPKRAYTGEHGVLTFDYIDYNRDDVRATYDLFRKLEAEHLRHPIALPMTQTMSPAAIGKAYLRQMGVLPVLDKTPAFPVERLGHATSAYFGGRAECHIRLTEVPVCYLDVSSMYPTVFALGDLWPYVVAERIEVRPATREARRLLRGMTRARLGDRAVWPRIAGVFCRIRPAGELLPVRAEYAANGWQIGFNYLDAAPRELWFTLADLVAGRILGGPMPEILEAFRLVPVGVQAGLQPVRLRGLIEIDPRRSDFFVRLVEERRRIELDPSIDPAERAALKGFLKTLANATSYGIWAEMRDEAAKARRVWAEVSGLSRFRCRVPRPERAGEYCFPPLAATITGLARLLLALIEAEVEALGGTYLATDTDSLLVVASRGGGELQLPSGERIRALSWHQVDQIRDRINRLNPYDHALVPDLLKLEDENFTIGAYGSIDRRQRVELLGVAISAKRFELFQPGGRQPGLRKASAHGLGALLAPVSATDGGSWIDEVWHRFIARVRGEPEAPIPDWYALPALSRVSASSAGVMRPFTAVNAGRPYALQVKPANFLLLAHDDPLVALPKGLDRLRLTLIAPFSSKPEQWAELDYRNRFDGHALKVTTLPDGSPGAVRVKTYGALIDEYGRHPESKSGDADGEPCTRATVGLLTRLHVRAARVRHIGKESNHLEEIEAGGFRTVEDPVPEYFDELGEWNAVLPVLRGLREELGAAALCQHSGLKERALRYALNGGRLPRDAARSALLALAQGLLPP